MSLLMISMIETDLMRSAPIGPGRDSKRIFGAPGLRSLQEQPGGLGEIGELARLVAHQILGRRAREQQRREALRHVAAQALEDGAGLLDQPARGALLVAAELRLDVHALLPGRRDCAICASLTDPHGGVEGKPACRSR